MRYRFLNTKLACAPINWSNDDLAAIGKDITYQQILSEIALAGYQGTEIGNKYPRNLQILKHQLTLRHLTIASAWFSSFILEQGVAATLSHFQKHVQFLKQLGCSVVVVSEQSHSIQQQKVSLFEHKYVLNKQEWKQLAAGLDELGDYARSQGLKLVYHHHMGTVVQTAAETSRLMELTDPKKVYLLFDTGHFFMSGDDPGMVIKQFGDRIAHIHLKDVRSSVVQTMKLKQTSFLEGVVLGMFTVPGDGNVCFDSVFGYLAKINYQGWMVVEAEQDPLKADPLEYAIKAMAFLKTKIDWK